MMRMADALDAAATVDRILHAPRGRLAVRLTVCKLATDEARYEDTRVVVLGGTGSGKSTLVSVLCHGADGRPLLDNGRGRARTAVFRHKHEVETGRTSALSQDSVGYDSEGCVINYAGVSTMTQAEVSASARKLVTLIDVGGHKRFIKTALNGLTAMTPDYAMLCIPCPPSDPARIASDPLSDIMIEHLTAAIGLGIPLILVITKARRACSIV
jgi:GTPase